MPRWIVPIKNSALPAVATPREIREELQAASTKFSATENTTFMSQVFLQACKKNNNWSENNELNLQEGRPEGRSMLCNKLKETC